MKKPFRCDIHAERIKAVGTLIAGGAVSCIKLSLAICLEYTNTAAFAFLLDIELQGVAPI